MNARWPASGNRGRQGRRRGAAAAGAGLAPWAQVERLEARQMPALVVLPIQVPEATTFSGPVATFAGNEVTANNVLDYSARVDWGDGTPVQVAPVTPAPGGGFVASGQHAYAKAGVYNVAVVLNGLASTSVTAVGTATIADVPPTLVTPGISATANAAFSGVVATFTDPGADAANQYIASINWGDGTATVGVVASAGSPNAFTISGGHVYTQSGVLPYTVTLRTQAGAVVAASANARIADPPPVVSAPAVVFLAGLTQTRVVATFTDADPTLTPASFAATIDWGDNTPTTAGTIAAAPGGGYTVSGTHAYATANNFTSKITVVRLPDNVAAPVANGQIIVNNPILTLTKQDITPATGLPFTGVVATLTDNNPGALPSDYAATIQWGDGAVTPGVVALRPGGGAFNIVGTHTYTTPNVSYPVVVTVARVATGQNVSTTGTATVSDAVLGLTASEVAAVAGQATTVTLGTLTDTNPSAQPGDYTVVVDWGDGTSSSTGPGGGVVVSPKPGGPAGTFLLTGTHTYAQPGTYSVRTVVTAPGHVLPADKTAVATVKAATSAITPLATTIVATTGAPFAGVVGSFTASPPAGPGAFVATINWGDDQTSAGQVVERAPGAYDVVGSHVYARPSPTSGTTPYFAVTVTVVRVGSNDAPTTIASRAVVSSPGFTGRLSPLFDTGVSNADGLTRLNQPTFIGTAPPFAVVQLYTRWSGQLAPVPFGRTIAGADGSWLIAAAGPLADGAYDVSAVVTPASGSPVVNAALPPLVIDTTPPHVGGLSYDAATNRAYLAVADGLSGFDLATLARPHNYNLIGPSGRLAPASALPRSVAVQLLLDNPRQAIVALEPKFPRDRLRGVRVVGGLADAAGNLLAGNGTVAGSAYVGTIAGPAGRFRRVGRRG